jgi:hypothetical protein
VEPGGLRPLRVGETLDVAIKLYRANFAALVRIVAIVTAPTQVLVVLLQASLPKGFETTSTGGFDRFGQQPVEPDIDGKKLTAFLLGTFAITIISFVATEIATAASFRSIGAAYLGEEQRWQDSLRYAGRRWRSIVWLTLLKDTLLFAGFIACIIPGVYFYAAFAVTTPILMLEGVKGTKALSRSRALVKGRWRPVAGVLLIGYLLTSVVGAALTGLVAGALFAGNEIASDVARAIAAIAASALTVPVLAAIVTVVYIDLRVRKEGFDLELLAESVGVDPTGLSVPSFVPDAPVAGDDDGEQPPFWPPPPGWKPRSQRE